MNAASASPRPLVLVDMDNTLVHFDAAFARRWAEIDSEYDAALHLPDREHFELEQNLPAHLRHKAEQIMGAPGFYASFEPVEGALDAVRAMVARGFEVRLCTAPHPLQWEECAREKYGWVRRHLGEEWMSRVIITRDKTCVRGTVLIDDKPAVTGWYARPAWTHVVFDRSYNRGAAAERAPRLKHWREWERVVLPLLTGER